MSRINSLEARFTNDRPITVTVDRVNSDIDCTFKAKPTGIRDIFLKTETAAVIQSVKNLLMTNHGEKPFAPKFGGNLGSFLFELGDAMDAGDVEELVQAALVYEPRAVLKKVETLFNPDYNSITVTVVFAVTATKETVTLNVNISRVR